MTFVITIPLCMNEVKQSGIHSDYKTRLPFVILSICLFFEFHMYFTWISSLDQWRIILSSLRWHQWCLCPMTRGPCLLPSTWSFVSMDTSTLGELMQSLVDTPSTKTTTNTSHTTRWWLPSGWSAVSVLTVHSLLSDTNYIVRMTEKQ